MSTLRSLSLGVGFALAAGAASLLHAPAAFAAEEPLPFELAPPVVEDMLITPTPQSGQGDALLQLIYAKEQQLPAEINFNVGDKPVVLRRDEKDPQLYSASIPFDFEGFVKEQSERKEQAGQKLTVPTFVGREFRGEAPMAFLEPETLRKQIELQLPIRIPFPVVFGPPALVRPERSLLINAPSVVEDPTRTFDLCTGAGNPNGAWTFNTLMTNMANQPVSGVNPADFVENWMRQWGSTQVINTFPAAARAQVINQVLNAWERDTVTGKLRLTGPLLADIFMGKIAKWNDAAIAAANPGTTLPDLKINVVHRSDGSGTTFNFSNYLSKVSPEWKTKVGEGTSVQWPGGVGGKGNEGVASYVKQIKGSVGYVELAYALQNKMAHTQLQNAAGQFVQPSAESFQAAASTADWASAKDFNLVITNASGEKSWPITATNFILMYKQPKDAKRSSDARAFFKWAFENGQAQAQALDYVPVPPELVKQIEAYWGAEFK